MGTYRFPYFLSEDGMIYGRNPMLLNVTYQKPIKKYDQKECFKVTYVDDSGQIRYSEEPGEADIYIVKPEYRTYTYTKPEELISHCDKIRTPISEIRYVILKAAGDWGAAILKKARETNDFKILNQAYKWPYAYKCDFQPEYYFIDDWYHKYTLNPRKITESFLDIETDLMDYQTDLDNIPGSAYAPVNCAVVVLEDSREVFQFILRPYEPPKLGRSEEEYKERYALYQKQLKDHQYLMSHLDEYYESCRKDFEPVYGPMTYHLREYEQEIELIADIFRLINNRKPMFCEMWNMRFDIQYLYYRIQTLGYDPKSIMCHPDFSEPKCYFKADRSTYLVEKQQDVFVCSSYTMYICQMRTNSNVLVKLL